MFLAVKSNHYRLFPFLGEKFSKLHLGKIVASKDEEISLFLFHSNHEDTKSEKTKKSLFT